MRLRHLNRHAWPIRRISFPAYALVLLSLLGSGRPLLWVLGLSVLIALWPAVVSRALPGATSTDEPIFHMGLIGSECLLASAVAGLLAAPDAVLLTVSVSLLSASALLLGARVLIWSGLGLCVGFTVGRLFSPVVPTAMSTPPLTEWLSVGLLLWLVLSVSLAAHRQSVRLAGERVRAVRRAQHLDGYTGRLARYLPRELTTLLRDQPAASRLSRRAWLCVVFVDLCGFSRLTERLEPEELAGILNAYLDGVAAYSDRCSAQIGHVAGDGVLVYFEAARETSRTATAQRASAFSRRLHAFCADELAATWRSQGVDVAPSLRIGVASGYCTLADWGGRRLEYTPIGSPVNRAARLQRGAAVGGIASDEVTARLLAAPGRSPGAGDGPDSYGDESRTGNQRQPTRVQPVPERLTGGDGQS